MLFPGNNYELRPEFEFPDAGWWHPGIGFPKKRTATKPNTPPYLRDIRACANNIKKILPLIQKYRGAIPLYFIYGWICVESGGRSDAHTSLDERGYFQVHPDESKDHGLDHSRIDKDPDYSVQSGIRLVNIHASWVRRQGFTETSPVFWHLVKFRHALPVLAKHLVKQLKAERFNPTNWEDLKKFAFRYFPGKAKIINNVDKVILRGNLIAQEIK